MKYKCKTCKFWQKYPEHDERIDPWLKECKSPRVNEEKTSQNGVLCWDGIEVSSQPMLTGPDYGCINHQSE